MACAESSSVNFRNQKRRKALRDGLRRLPPSARTAAHSNRIWGPRAATRRGRCSPFVRRASETSRVGRRASGNSRTGGARMTRPLHFHLSGIGGAAMTPIAGMLAERGHRVTGSDAGFIRPRRARHTMSSLGKQMRERRSRAIIRR